jgi:rod shape-determining protein MreC
VRNIFFFIRRFSNLLLFLVFQVLALYMLFRFNRFHEGLFANVANNVTGKINEQYNRVEYYFQLTKTNEQLAKENERLHNMLRTNFEAPDSTQKVLADTLVIDTLGNTRTTVKFVYREAKVVNNSVTSQTNTLTLHRGSAQGIKKDMAVISSEGVVGRVIEVNENYSVVMSMLHRQSVVNGMLKKTKETGRVVWDGNKPGIVTLYKIPKSVTVAIGDSVVSSIYSDVFPPGILVGVVKEVTEDKTSGDLVIKLRTATNFYNVQYVYVIENRQRDEQKELEDRVKKQK